MSGTSCTASFLTFDYALRYNQLINHYLKMCETSALHSVVDNVGCPRLALDRDHHTLFGFMELHEKYRTEIPILILIREVFVGNGIFRVVFNGASILDVCGVLALAIDPNLPVLLRLVVFDVLYNFVPDVLGHLLDLLLLLVFRRVQRLFIIRFWNPTVDLVELEKDAGATRFVPVVRLIRTRPLVQLGHVDFTHLIYSGMGGARAVDLSLCLCERLVVVRLQVVVETSFPALPVPVVVPMPEPDQRRLNVRRRVGHRSESNTWVATDDTVAVEPSGLLVVKGLVEDQEHSHEEAGEEGIVDDVENANLKPAHSGSAEELPGLGVPDELGEPLPSRLLLRLGCKLELRLDLSLLVFTVTPGHPCIRVLM